MLLAGTVLAPLGKLRAPLEILLLLLCVHIRLGLSHPIVLKTSAAGHRHHRYSDQQHHLTELVCRNKTKVIFLPFLELGVDLCLDLLTLATLHGQQVFFVVLTQEEGTVMRPRR
jgi:hypothetical protein